MALANTVDAYCERIDASFWSEPYNALTNVAFLIAAIALWRALQRHGAGGAAAPLAVRCLPWSLALIGLCSFLFHTLATVWAGLADTLSILLFGCAFLYAFLRHAARINRWIALAGAASFTAASYFAPGFLPDGFLNQSGAYFPYVAGLSAITAYQYAERRANWRVYLLALLVFCVSLALRTIDQAVCAAFPLGTHFMWHVLNAAVLFVLSRELARDSGAGEAPLTGSRARA
jgi:hypothetical protein